ncbi:Tellurite resistance protein TerB [Planctomycetes bacterium CA13]|uniref:Tellurite resistance protein TerB n=1 Tax=Novipirellula herctigrandis TaxID=2527986 RepID=A0A5C5ZC23_9BACT|nr:Tellurite resistance protein TerB [Planctomycetes bacterium CA13]
MILIGTMNLTRTRDRGNFYCPTCRTPQSYRLRARRPFLTVYFIPTVPIAGAEEFVQCDECRSTWDITVLEIDRESQKVVAEDQFHDEAIRSCLLVVLADGHISEPEIEALHRIAANLFSRHIDREELGRLASIATQKGVTATNYILTISRRWNESQKRKALQGMFLAASAEGELGPLQTEMLAKMRELLDLTDLEYQSAIEETLNWGE